MGFETKVRGLIVELLEPFLEKSIKDRELIYKMEKEDEKFRSKINLLEMAVYKQDSQTGSTIFDEIQDKLIDINVQINQTK